MKQAILILIGLFAALCIQAADITPITNAFNSGNASALSGSMDTEVDVAVPGTSKKGSAGDAVAVLNTFFNNNKPTGFTVVHHADKKENGFLVGKLPSSTGEYRVNVTYRTDGNKAIIQSIRIE